MLELDQNEIDEVSGGKTVKEVSKFSVYASMITEFCGGFWAGVKAGYNA